MQVVNLAECRELLTLWADVRDRIVRGDLKSVHVAMACRHGDEVSMFAGMKDQSAIRTTMRAMVELSKEVDRADRAADPPVQRVAALRRRD